MAYTDTWNAAFEALPADGDNVSEGAERIRDLKLAVEERMQKDHYWAPAGTDANHGEHVKITFNAQSAKPAAVANKLFLYTKDVSAKVELFAEDEDGDEIQLTSGGAPYGSIPAGTYMLFYQDTAPSGWTIQNALNDKLLFVTKGSAAGGETGGGAHSTGTWELSGLDTGDVTLATTQIPAHTHTYTPDLNRGGSGTNCFSHNDSSGSSGTAQTSGSTGGGTAHAHTIAADDTWRPAAYCVIIAVKA